MGKHLTHVQIRFLKDQYFGQHDESTEKVKSEPGFENTQNLSKKLIISMGTLKF
jgi:hypothetical protein